MDCFLNGQPSLLWWIACPDDRREIGNTFWLIAKILVVTFLGDLILVVVDDIFWPPFVKGKPSTREVLILVVVDDTFWHCLPDGGELYR